MRVDTQTLIDWLRAKAASDLATDRVIEAKQARAQADECLGEREARLLNALGIQGNVADLSITGSVIEIRKLGETLTVYLDGRVEDSMGNL